MLQVHENFFFFTRNFRYVSIPKLGSHSLLVFIMTCFVSKPVVWQPFGLPFFPSSVFLLLMIVLIQYSQYGRKISYPKIFCLISVYLTCNKLLQLIYLGENYLWPQKLLGEYTKWLQSKRDQDVQFYKQSFEKRWTSSVNPSDQIESGTSGVLERKSEVSIRVIEDFSAAAASKLFERYIREVVRLSANAD